MLTKEQAFKKYGDFNNKNSHINWEGVETALQGDEWIPEFSEFIFDPKKLEDSFSLIKKSKTWYPKPDTFLDIKMKIGVEFVNVLDNKGEIIEYIKDTININMMHCISELEEPRMRSKAISVRVTKAGRCRNGDGTFSISGPCSAEHNFYDKVLQSWVGQNAKDYNSAGRRLSSYMMKKEHALAIAQTKARNAVITVLAGLKKGFTTDDLQSGCFGFVKFVRSPQYQKMYSMARIDAIRKGNTGEIKQISSEVFGDQSKIEAPIIDDISTEQHTEKANPFTKFNKTETKNIQPVDEREKIKNIFKIYLDKKDKNRVILAKSEGAISSIENAIDNYKKEDLKTLKNLLNIIESVPGITKIDHDIVLEKEEGELF